MKRRQQTLKEKENENKYRNQTDQKTQTSTEESVSNAGVLDILEKINPLLFKDKNGNTELMAQVISDVMNVVNQQLECYICHELMQFPILNCNKGHPLCSGCFNKLTLKVCPMCQSPIASDSKSCPLEAIAEVWAFPCRNEGCGELVQRKLRKEHEDECPHFVFKCMYLDFSGNHSQLVEHCELHQVANVQSNVPQHIKFGTGRAIYIRYCDDMFALSTSHISNSANLRIDIKHYGLKSRARKFLVKLQLNSKGDVDNIKNLVYNVIPQSGHDVNTESSISLPSASWLITNGYLADNHYDIHLTMSKRVSA